MITIGVLAYIPTPRHRQLLEQTLTSLANQIDAPRFRILLIDNGNSIEDESLRNWLAETAQKYHVTLYRRENREIAAARDFVVRSQFSEGDEIRYVGFVDSDVEVPSNWLARMAKELEQEESVVAVASSNHPPMRESAFDDALYAMFQAPWNFLGSAQALQLKGGHRDVDHLSSCAVLYRRASILSAGGYVRAFTLVCEDLELSQRLRKLGTLRLLGDAPVVHRQDQDALSWWMRMFRYGWGQIEVMRTHHSQAISLKGSLIPLSLVLWILLFLAIQGAAWPLSLFLGLYFVLVAGGLLVGANKSTMAVRINAFALTVGTHVFYILGMYAGAFGLKRNPTHLNGA